MLNSLRIGKRLFTRDGRHVGNGIIKGRENVAYGHEGRYSRIWVVETDFGNTMRLGDPELESMYHLDYEPEPGPYEHSLEEWMNARFRNIAQPEPKA